MTIGGGPSSVRSAGAASTGKRRRTEDPTSPVQGHTMTPDERNEKLRRIGEQCFNTIKQKVNENKRTDEEKDFIDRFKNKASAPTQNNIKKVLGVIKLLDIQAFKNQSTKEREPALERYIKDWGSNSSQHQDVMRKISICPPTSDKHKKSYTKISLDKLFEDVKRGKYDNILYETLEKHAVTTSGDTDTDTGGDGFVPQGEQQQEIQMQQQAGAASGYSKDNINELKLDLKQDAQQQWRQQQQPMQQESIAADGGCPYEATPIGFPPQQAEQQHACGGSSTATYPQPVAPTEAPLSLVEIEALMANDPVTPAGAAGAVYPETEGDLGLGDISDLDLEGVNFDSFPLN